MIKVETVYPITTKVFPDGTKMVYISDSDIKEYTTPVQLPKLLHFMRGQTMYIAGYYPSDIERWLNREENSNGQK